MTGILMVQSIFQYFIPRYLKRYLRYLYLIELNKNTWEILIYLVNRRFLDIINSHRSLGTVLLGYYK